MKTMTCKQLAGACDMPFHAETFEDMAKLSQQHAVEMSQKGEESHLKALEEMKAKMNNPKAMQEWMDQKREEFIALPENKKLSFYA